jgi:hypothetical protein
VDDYGTNVGALAARAGFPIRFAGAAILGFRLAHAYNAVVKNPRHGGTSSGSIATVVYSTNPQKLGAADSRLTFSFARRDTHAGAINDGFIGGGRQAITANGLVGYSANRNQLVFRFRNVIGVITSSLDLSSGQWTSILVALRSP